MKSRLERIRWRTWQPKLFRDLAAYDRHALVADLIAGLTVGVVALPLAMAFGIASGVKPEQGLVTSVVAGFLISLLGGSRVQIGGPAGAFVALLYAIVERHGVAGLMLSTIMAGGLLVAMGASGVRGRVRLDPGTPVPAVGSTVQAWWSPARQRVVTQ